MFQRSPSIWLFYAMSDWSWIAGMGKTFFTRFHVHAFSILSIVLTQSFLLKILVRDAVRHACQQNLYNKNSM